MKTITVPRTVHDTKFESFDGEVFGTSAECKDHEDKVKFDEFKYDKSKAYGELTVENWKHHMFRYLDMFNPPPRESASLILEETYLRTDWVDGKQVKIPFDINEIKKWFIQKFINLFAESMLHPEVTSNNGYSGSRPTSRIDELKESATEDMLHIMKFFFVDGPLKFEETFIEEFFKNHNVEAFYRAREYATRNGKEFKEPTYQQKVDLFLSYIFRECFRNDAFEVLDIAIDKFGLDLNKYVFDTDTRGSWGSHSMKKDLITQLACFSFKDYDRGGIDCFKRALWIEYLIDKDLSGRIFRFRTGMSTYNGKSTTTCAVQPGEENFIYFSIEDLIKEVKEKTNDPYVYLFKKNNEKVIKALENCGKNFKEANKDNKKEEYYALVEESFEIIKEVFEENPEVDIIFDDVNFEVKRVVSENMPYNSGRDTSYYRKAKEIRVAIRLEAFNQMDDKGKSNIVEVSGFGTEGWATDKNIPKDSFSLEKFSGDSSALATEIIYYLTEGEMTINSERVSEIDIRILDIKNKQIQLEKELKELNIEKKKTLNIKRK
jgi:hypothetical protein